MANGGLGVALFSRFDTTRHFFLVRPIAVSPIGVSFFSGRAIPVLMSELRWVIFPAIAFALAALGVRKMLTWVKSASFL
jgi:inner membrane protein